MRVLIFLAMFLFSAIDFAWAFLNLFKAGALYAMGILFQIWGFKTFGKGLQLYGRNIGLSVDQFLATKAMGQDPDVSISMALGVAKLKKAQGAKVNPYWIWLGRLVDFLFAFDPDHITNAIEKEETSKATVVHLYKEHDKKEAA